jgi:hypothetical protein
VKQKRLFGMPVEGEAQTLVVGGLEAAREGQQAHQMAHGRSAPLASHRPEGPIEGLVLPAQLRGRPGEMQQQSIVARVLAESLARQRRYFLEPTLGEQRGAEPGLRFEIEILGRQTRIPSRGSRGRRRLAGCPMACPRGAAHLGHAPRRPAR